MTTFRLSSPPRSPGIYALKNRKTGHVYIGQSLNLYRRFEEWRGLLRAGVGKASKLFVGVARATAVEDWDFVILAQVTRGDAKRLDSLEARAIQKTAARIGERCLNCAGNRPAPNPERQAKPANTRKSAITDENGLEMTYGAAAKQLGVTHQAVKKRMQSARARGVFKVNIQELRAPQNPFNI